MSRAPTYGTYLQLDRLLSAQRPPDYARAAASPDGPTRDLLHHDEMLFVVVHQVFELWFKLVLHELGRARDLLGRLSPGQRPDTVEERHVPEISAALVRVNEILRVAIDHFRVVETMPTLSFLAFRDAITPASGFQSVQFRELEIMAGAQEAREAAAAGRFAALLSPPEAERLARRLAEPTLKEVLLDWLGRTPIERAFPRFAEEFVSAFDRYCDDQRDAHLANPYAVDAERAAACARIEEMRGEARRYVMGGDAEERRANRAFLFITTYREEPLLRWPAILLDGLVEFEQNFRAFRFRHARMVERMIGSRTGSGGSSGVGYLDRTAGYKIFGHLLEARNFLLDRRRLPELPSPDVFRFRFDS